MGPLVYYCRWRGAKLRLRGRDEQRVWGELVLPERDGDRIEKFRFDNQTWELVLGEGDAQERFQLDEMGVVIATNGPPLATTSAGAGP